MKIKFGLISADSHAQLDRDAFTRRMSRTKWGERIPQVVEVKDDRSGRSVERWTIDGKVTGYTVSNCPAVMNDRKVKYYPQRWEEVPPKVYAPLDRAKALDEDGVDAEVLFPNTPVQNFSFLQGIDPEYELACIQAYNSALAEWREQSDRFVPLALIPYLGGIAATVAEVERAVKIGHRGIAIVCEPSTLIPNVPHINAPYWYPLWEVCQAADFPVHLHESGGPGLGNYVSPLGRLHAQPGALGPHGADRRFSRGVYTEPPLLRHSRSLSAPQMGFSRDRARMGQLRHRRMRSRMGAA